MDNQSYLQGEENILDELMHLKLTFSDRGGRYFETDKLMGWMRRKKKEIKLAKKLKETKDDKK